jgi:DNA-binding CsgD family transcriptional regulator
MQGSVTVERHHDDGGADDPTSLWRLQRLLDWVDVPVFLIELSERRGCFGNAAAGSLMGTNQVHLEQMLQMDLERLVGAESAARIEQGLAALVTGAVRSYQGERTYADCSGGLIHAEHTVTRLDLCESTPVAVGVVTRRSSGWGAGLRYTGVAPPSLLSLDHQGRVDAATPDIEPRLALGSSDLLGRYFHDLVHPGDRQDVIHAYEGALSGDAATTTVCVRIGDDWRAADLVLGALCRHRPHRVALLVTVHGDARSARVASCPTAIESLTLDGAQLTAQQQDVVTRLLRGESIATMAAGMHLSRSTVRNHLCAVYAKVGVHSQAELIARITGRRATHPDDGRAVGSRN